MIEGVAPQVDGGRFAAKRARGEAVDVEADLFADGHDQLRAVLRHRPVGSGDWAEIEMEPLVNDRWRAQFTPDRLGRWEYGVTGWVDRFRTWHHGLERKVAAGVDVAVELLEGAELVRAASERAAKARPDRGGDGASDILAELAEQLADDDLMPADRIALLDDEALALIDAHPDRSLATDFDRTLEVVVDPPLARCSAWYELFPRSASPDPARTGTLADVETRLPDIAEMGFDVVYLPPVHPIGRDHRKGPNNVPEAGPDDPGSPWAIGSDEGGHTAIHPELGTVDDLRRLVQAARDHRLEVALDIAFQCAPDHPWVKEHPEWFRWRPDGTVQYAENPPKKYQDIYPLEFETDSWRELWEALRDVFLYWVDQGVRVFRVDNPHTKPFPFWEWAIAEITARHPDVIFLSEAFTRPKVMHRLAKVGFNQSYTYFAWRQTKWELMEYFTELTAHPSREYFRPNVWPNTPDILTSQLQTGLRQVYIARLVLAATLAASYGIYGPAFELREHEPREPGSEEYLRSEKYEVRQWDHDRPGNIREVVTLVNRIRRQNPALHHDWNLRFHPVDNGEIIAYSKATPDRDNVILTVVNLDPHHTQSGTVELDLAALGIADDRPFQVDDLLAGGTFHWHGDRNYVELNPHVTPAHIFRVRGPVHTERDFPAYA